MGVITFTGQIVVESCCVCGVSFGLPADLRQQRLDKGGEFWCPNGHRQHYTKPTVQVLEERLRREKRRAEAIAEQRDAARQTAKAYKGHFTRAKNQVKRVENGVCPHCNRSFQDLRAHMRSKHEEHVS